MSQMRKDVFTGRWVIMAETDTVRPTDLAQVVVDMERLIEEIRRLQFACDEIAREYARLCNRCGKRKQCEMTGAAAND